MNMTGGSKWMIKLQNSSVSLGKWCTDSLMHIRSYLFYITFSNEINENKLATSDKHLRNIYVLIIKTFDLKLLLLIPKLWITTRLPKENEGNNIKGNKTGLTGACKSLLTNLSMYHVCKKANCLRALKQLFQCLRGGLDKSCKEVNR
jgi:hypothetical protein